MNNFDVIKEIAVDVNIDVDMSPLDGKTILVTGASGLLGTHILSALQHARDNLNLDIEIHAQTKGKFNLSTGGNNNLSTIIHYANLANDNDCKRLPNADVIISAASYAQPLRFLSEPLMALRASSYGLMNLLEKCNVGGRFMYISSSEVYCDSLANPPYREEDTGSISPYHPRACYIEGKRFGEAVTYLYRNRGISTVAVRPGITYGPGFKKGDKRSWAQFVERALTESEIKMMDAGNVKRTFCYMSDGIELLFKVLLYGTQTVYNLSGKSSMSIFDLAEKIGEIAHVPVLVPEDDKGGVAGTPDDLQLNTELIESEFPKENWIGINEGFTKTIEWARENLYK
ncbi:MAG: NAD-dependent epimerase/dehydratase family protein [Candidatus Omnitrophica bacterium]|nr:NAD-dependent epimerase/dehydratase family protein [Candidatus Omnitrophota bacterium]